MFRELNELAKVIAHNTNCRVYSAGINDRYIYPYRLANTQSISPQVRDACYDLLLDSRYEDESVSNSNVLETAAEYNVDACFPKDYPGNIHRTHASFEQFAELYDAHDWNGRVYVILQPPHAQHYTEYADVYEEYTHFALGGLHDLSTERQIQEIRAAHEVLGEQDTMHLLGVGTSPEMVKFLRQEQLADSIDTSTPENAIKNGYHPDRTWEQKTVEAPSGDPDSSTIRGLYAKVTLYQLNYMLSPLADDDQIPVDEDTIHPDTVQGTLESIDQMQAALQ